jgi:hypothetical protein
MLQRPALANGYGWQRFLHSVNQVMPKRGDILELRLEFPEPVAGPHKKRRQIFLPVSRFTLCHGYSFYPSQSCLSTHS